MDFTSFTGVLSDALQSLKAWLRRSHRREVLYHLFMEEVLATGNTYCTVGTTLFDDLERTYGKRQYRNSCADFSSYTRDNDPCGLNGKELSSLLQPSNGEVPTFKEMAKRRHRATRNEVLAEVREEYPKVYGALKELFERGWVYQYEVQKAFCVKPTKSNPYTL